ncbi:hypothetical protein [Elizabethkingia anophelis]|uniref:hypothetical protein n=1 Tax=Elizabethkingia anophelis TaxID=1117645 RepID=UPI0029244713|nr:MAG: hypothetical protein PQ275_17930 [Elizabethkingia anophelis]
MKRRIEVIGVISQWVAVIVSISFTLIVLLAWLSDLELVGIVVMTMFLPLILGFEYLNYGLFLQYRKLIVSEITKKKFYSQDWFGSLLVTLIIIGSIVAYSTGKGDLISLLLILHLIPQMLLLSLTLHIRVAKSSLRDHITSSTIKQKKVFKTHQLKSLLLRLTNTERKVLSMIIGVAFSLFLGVICGEKEYYSYYENKRIPEETYNIINDETMTYSKFNPNYILIICGFPFFSGIAYLALKQRGVGTTNNE